MRGCIAVSVSGCTAWLHGNWARAFHPAHLLRDLEAARRHLLRVVVLKRAQLSRQHLNLRVRACACARVAACACEPTQVQAHACTAARACVGTRVRARARTWLFLSTRSAASFWDVCCSESTSHRGAVAPLAGWGPPGMMARAAARAAQRGAGRGARRPVARRGAGGAGLRQCCAAAAAGGLSAAAAATPTKAKGMLLLTAPAQCVSVAQLRRHCQHAEAGPMVAPPLLEPSVYDVIVLGSGLVECLLAGCASQGGGAGTAPCTQRVRPAATQAPACAHCQHHNAGPWCGRAGACCCWTRRTCTAQTQPASR